MPKGTFYEGLCVSYKDIEGLVHFVGDEYITVCLQNGHTAVNDLCIVVYEEDWKKIRLVKESNK